MPNNVDEAMSDYMERVRRERVRMEMDHRATRPSDVWVDGSATPPEPRRDLYDRVTQSYREATLAQAYGAGGAIQPTRPTESHSVEREFIEARLAYRSAIPHASEEVKGRFIEAFCAMIDEGFHV